MNIQELIEKISQLKGVKPLAAYPGTFMNTVPLDERNTIHFVRPVAADVVLKASSMNAPTEDAIQNTARLLDFGSASLSLILGKQVVRLNPFASGSKVFDTFLALGPSITNCVIGGGHFLKTRTIECYAINHIEFAGDETEAEAVVRKKHVRLSDVKREITPVIFGRYHKQTGQRSHDYLAIATHESTALDIRQLPRDGGVVEFENWERARLTLTADRGNEDIGATFSGETKTISVAQALKLMDELTCNGADAARKLW